MNTLPAIALCFASALAFTAAALPRVSPCHIQNAPAVPSSERLTAEDHDAIADLINTLPQWPTEGEVTVDEWKTLCRVAWSLQGIATNDLMAALTRFMDKYAPGTPTEKPLANDPRTKPLMLLKMMFDFSKPKHHDERVIQADREARQMQTSGPFTFQSRDRPWTALELLGMPIEWTDDRPHLLALRGMAENQVGGERRKPYQPQFELLHFAKFYEHRQDLGRYLGLERAPGWRSLIPAAKNAP